MSVKLSKYSFGVGDRFGHQGVAQLRAIMRANRSGLEICPVWNKSNREHSYVGSAPADVRREADAAVAELGFDGAYFVDADHINMSTVGKFVDASDFFTLDVASFIGKESPRDEVSAFVASCAKYTGVLTVPGIAHSFELSDALLESIASKFLAAATHASDIYHYLCSQKGEGNFVAEVSMDEVESPQTPVELLFILKMLADKGVKAQTIAPKFTGRFNKGVDYVGDLARFAQEFEEDLMVVDFAVKEFNLPEELKLSVHSGSDKFSIYPIMGEAIKKYNKGIHVKTAGTTWLEEVIGLALAGGEALEMAKLIYTSALGRKDELCAPYADVIDIDENKLPSVGEVAGWNSRKFADTLRHIPECQEYSSDFRQLVHVGYKVAAELGERYTDMLKAHAEIVGACVEENIYERHLKRLFNLVD